MGLPWWSWGWESACHAGDSGLISGPGVRAPAHQLLSLRSRAQEVQLWAQELQPLKPMRPRAPAQPQENRREARAPRRRVALTYCN